MIRTCHAFAMEIPVGGFSSDTRRWKRKPHAAGEDTLAQASARDGSGNLESSAVPRRLSVRAIDLRGAAVTRSTGPYHLGRVTPPRDRGTYS